MSAAEDIRTAFLADGTVSGLIGTRFYPLVIPQDAALPAIAYQQISGTTALTLSTGYIEAHRFQLRLVAETYASLETLAAACMALNGTSASEPTGRMQVEAGPDGINDPEGYKSRILEVYTG